MVTKTPSGALVLRNTKANFDPKASLMFVSLDILKEERTAKVEWLEAGDSRLIGMTNVPTDERIIQVLARGENSISTPQEIARELGIEAKTVSNHLSSLRSPRTCGAVGRRSDGVSFPIPLLRERETGKHRNPSFDNAG